MRCRHPAIGGACAIAPIRGQSADAPQHANRPSCAGPPRLRGRSGRSTARQDARSSRTAIGPAQLSTARTHHQCSKVSGAGPVLLLTARFFPRPTASPLHSTVETARPSRVTGIGPAGLAVRKTQRAEEVGQPCRVLPQTGKGGAMVPTGRDPWRDVSRAAGALGRVCDAAPGGEHHAGGCRHPPVGRTPQDVWPPVEASDHVPAANQGPRRTGRALLRPSSDLIGTERSPGQSFAPDAASVSAPDVGVRERAPAEQGPKPNPPTGARGLGPAGSASCVRVSGTVLPPTSWPCTGEIRSAIQMPIAPTVVPAPVRGRLGPCGARVRPGRSGRSVQPTETLGLGPSNGV